jgi:hypothetical protein
VAQLLGYLLFFVYGKVFRFRPRIRRDGGRLVATSGRRSQVFSLGLWWRRVTVDRNARTIRIESRGGWIFRSARTIPFDRIAEVLYGYGQLDPSSYAPMAAYHDDDLFTVGLLLDDNKEVPLFRFYGTGSFTNNTIWPDWMYFDSTIMERLTQGPQEDESLYFADALALLIGVPIGNPRP